MINYVYAAMWFIVGLLLIFRMGRENKVFYFAGGVFLIMAGWWLAEALTDLKMFQGAWGIAFRVIMAATLLLTGYVYFKERKRAALEQAEAEDEERDGALLPEDGAGTEYGGDSEPYYDQASSEEDALPEENAGISPAETAEKRGEED